MTASLTPSLIPPLTYRPVDPSSPEDKATLIAMREACGWGVADVPVNLANIAAGSEAMWIFSIEDEPAGMGGIVFEGKLPECSSKKEGRMMITRLYLYDKFQGKAYGNQIMTILERLCFDTYAAKAVTLTTTAFEPYAARSDEEATGMGKTRLWYLRRGYKEFQEMRPLYVDAANPNSPLTIACFLEKSAPAGLVAA